MNNMDWALAYAAAGFAVIPVWYPSEENAGVCACEKGEACDRPAKHPIPKQGVKQATTDTGRIRAWWTEHPDANVAIATGSVSKCIVIDVDVGNGKEGDIAITQACAENGGVPQTLKARSGSGGMHYIYKWRENPFTRKIGFLKHVDYLSDGGYVIVQPSSNLKGAYAFDPEFGIELPKDLRRLRENMAELPEWFDKIEGHGKSGRKSAKRKTTANQQRPSTVAAMEFNREDPKWITEVRRALTFCDPDSRDLWVLFGIILGRTFERSDDGWSIYDEWCARSSKYSEKGTQEGMRSYYYTESLNEPQGGTPAGIGTIFHHASESGWTMPLSGLDNRPTIVYRAGRAIETVGNIMRLLEAERETEGDITRIFSFGSGLGAVIETHDSGSMYSKEGKPPNGWVLRVNPYNSMHLGSRITHSATIVKISASGAAQQVECPTEVSDHILSTLGKSFPRLNGIVQWPMVIDGELVGVDADYDPRAGLLFSVPASMDFNLKGSKKEASEAWDWIRKEAFADFPFGSKEDEASALAVLLTFMQRRAIDMSPAFLITAPLQGTGKTAFIKFASRVVHGRSIGASSLSMNDEEQRKSITAALMNNPPALLFDNLAAGSMFDSKELAIAMTSSEWEDRKLGHTERLTLPNRAVWCFTGNNVSLVSDLRRRFVTIRMVPAERMHYAKHFKRELETWAIEHRGDVLKALAAISLWGAREKPALPTESGFPGWDRSVRGPVLAVTGIDPYRASSTEADEEDPMEEAVGALMMAWATFMGPEKGLVRDFNERVEDATKSADSGKKRLATEVVRGIAVIRQKEVKNISSADWGYAIRSMMDRLTWVCGVEAAFRRQGMRGGSALWKLDHSDEIAAKCAGEF